MTNFTTVLMIAEMRADLLVAANTLRDTARELGLDADKIQASAIDLPKEIRAFASAIQDAVKEREGYDG